MYVASLIVLRECPREVILGKDFLREHVAVIDIRQLIITISDKHACVLQCGNTRKFALRASMFVSGERDCDHKSSGLAEGKLSVLLARRVCVNHGIAQLNCKLTELLVGNFSGEYQHLAERAVITQFDEIGVVRCSTLAELSAAIKSDTVIVSTVDINPEHSPTQKERIRGILHRFSDYFVPTSKVEQTRITKHRIITDPTESPLRQRGYRVSQKEQEAARSQVKQMLDDDLIQPSNSPRASPVVLVKKDSALRSCVDYHELSKVTKKRSVPSSAHR